MTLFLKINIALVLSAVFIFRILFVNVGMVSPLNTPKSNTVIKSHFSTVMKRSKHLEVLSGSEKSEHSLPEICEECANGNKQLKATPFFLIQTLYSPVAGEIKNNLQKITFDKYIPCISSTRNLIFRTLRI